MIAYLKGKVLQIDDTEIIVDVRDVGYRLQMTGLNIAKLQVDDEQSFYVYTHVREDALQLFGFLENDERRLFAKLLTISGVGPKLALAILNTLSPYTLQQAVSQKNLGILKQIPGVGPKTAQRLMLDLDSVLKKLHFTETTSTGTPFAGSAKTHADTRSALANLGYQERVIDEAIEAMRKEASPDLDTAGEIRWALSWLSKKWK